MSFHACVCAQCFGQLGAGFDLWVVAEGVVKSVSSFAIVLAKGGWQEDSQKVWFELMKVSESTEGLISYISLACDGGGDSWSERSLCKDGQADLIVEATPNL